MDTRGTAHRGDHAFSERYSRRDGTAGLLGSDQAALLFADAGFRDRPVGPRPAPQTGDRRQALAAYLRPLIGTDAPAVASCLLDRFGTIGRVIEASPEALANTLDGYGNAVQVICAARGLMQFAANEQLVGCKVDPRDKNLHKYLRAKLHNPVEERMHAVFLDRNQLFLAGENVAVGTVGAMLLRIRHVVHRAFDLGASGVLLAHNHPSGSCQPSEADHKSNDRFTAIAEALELQIIDHLIVSTDGTYSMKRRRIL